MKNGILLFMLLSPLVLIASAEDALDRTVEGVTLKITQSVTPENCQRIEFNLPSESMGRDIRVVMILPPDFDEDGGKTYPFLYMLHGANAPYDTWSQMSPLRGLLKDHPMVLVAFDGDPLGFYLDAPAKKESQFETFFFDELSPFVEKVFRGNGQRASGPVPLEIFSGRE